MTEVIDSLKNLDSFLDKKFGVLTLNADSSNHSVKVEDIGLGPTLSYSGSVSSSQNFSAMMESWEKGDIQEATERASSIPKNYFFAFDDSLQLSTSTLKPYTYDISIEFPSALQIEGTLSLYIRNSELSYGVSHPVSNSAMNSLHITFYSVFPQGAGIGGWLDVKLVGMATDVSALLS